MNAATILLLGVLAILVMAGSRLGFGRRRLSPWLQPLVDTGTVFVFIGAAIGPQGAALITGEALRQFDPLIVIGLGWIGFLYGSHFEWRQMRRYPTTIYAFGMIVPLVTFALIFALAWPAISYWIAPDAAWADRFAAAAVLGICGAGTAPAGIFKLMTRWHISARDLNVLRFVGTVDDLPPLAGLALLDALIRPAGDTTAWLWVPLTAALGLALGRLAHWLFPKGDDVRHNFIILFGLIALGSGAASVLRISPIFVMALAGFTFANLSARKESAFGMLARREHSLYAIFLVLAGTIFHFEWDAVGLLVPAYLLVRALGKVVGGYLGWRFFLDRQSVNRWIGAGLMFQGGMALVMAVSFAHSHGTVLAHQVATAIVVAVVLNELLGPPMAGLVLGKRRDP